MTDDGGTDPAATDPAAQVNADLATASASLATAIVTISALADADEAYRQVSALGVAVKEITDQWDEDLATARGQQLGRIREQHQLTLAKLAERTNLSVTRVHQLSRKGAA